MRTQGRRGDDGSHTASPPPPCRGTSAAPRACALLASCLRRACYAGKVTRAPPPPHTPPPPQGWGMKVGGAESGPPPKDKAAGWGGSGERVRDGPHDRARREHAPCKPQQGGPPGVRTQGREGDDGSHTASPPPPCKGTGAAPRACAVLASCLRHACYEGKTTSPPPPPHTPPPPQGWGMQVGGGGRRPPPPRGQSGRVGRQRREGAGRTTRPCP